MRRWWCKARATLCATALAALPPTAWFLWMNEANEKILARYLPEAWKPYLAEAGIYGTPVGNSRSWIPVFGHHGGVFKFGQSGELKFETKSGWYYRDRGGNHTFQGQVVWAAQIRLRPYVDEEKQKLCDGELVDFIVTGHYWAGKADGTWMGTDSAAQASVIRIYQHGIPIPWKPESYKPFSRNQERRYAAKNLIDTIVELSGSNTP